MSMISELVERLRRYARFSKTNTPSWSEAMTQAADTIEELSAKLSASQMERSDDWILCEERMPESDGMYLITSNVLRKSEVQFVFFQKNINMFICNGNAIAWRPLPEPYREVRDEAD